jgi:ABC-type transporter Mla maintaining outer membrane lipid asymmetry ATPase subunit MlaF
MSAHADAVPALEMRDVAVPALREPGRTVLEAVHWRVAGGDFWAVGGLLRSGKSDLMALAAGLMRPVRGDCRVFGQAPAAGFEREPTAARPPVGLVFDGGQLLHHLSLAENIALPLRYHRNLSFEQALPEVEAWLRLTGLEAWGRQMPAAVSRNWQQRIGLARALTLQPRLLLLDNPLTGLDPRDAGWWLETLGALARGQLPLCAGPLTIVVTGDDLRPWKGRARQFAALHERAFTVLEQPEDFARLAGWS